MAQADWHLRDLLQFYVSRCRNELLSVSNDPIQAESLFEAVKKVRELMLIMSCMVGAFTPAEILALNRLEQVRLVAENQSAQMLRVGEDMAMLRIWVRSAVDSQYNVREAIKLMRTGGLSNVNSFPEMMPDLLTSLNKSFIVPSKLPVDSASISAILREHIKNEFEIAKNEFPRVPSRVLLEFDECEGGTVILSSPKEFVVKGIYDGKAWTILEANILNDTSLTGSLQCKRIVQSSGAQTVSDLIVTLLRMSTAQKLKSMQEEIVILLKQREASSDSSVEFWSPVHSLEKNETGIGSSFVVNIYRRLPARACVELSMHPDNGDLVIAAKIAGEVVWTCDNTNLTVFQIIDIVAQEVGRRVLLGVGGVESIYLPPNTLLLENNLIVVTLLPSGMLSLGCMFSKTYCCPVPGLDETGIVSKYTHILTIIRFIINARKIVSQKESEGWRQCAWPSSFDQSSIEPTESSLLGDSLMQIPYDQLKPIKFAFRKNNKFDQVEVALV